MGFTDFLWTRFGKSMLQKGAVAFLAALGSLALAPHVAPILATLGVVVTPHVDYTIIRIEHATFAAGLSAVAFMGLEALRILAQKHPKSPLPEPIKRVL